MRSLLLTIVFLGIIGYLGTELYKRTKAYDWSSTPEAPNNGQLQHEPSKLPTDLEIEATDGRTLRVTAMARNETHIQFRRHSDDQVFVYPLSKLTKASRNQILSYAATGLADTEAGLIDTRVDIGKDPTVLSEIYVEQLKEEIRRIGQRLTQIESESRSTTSQTTRRTLQREAEKLIAERQKFVEATDERQQ